MLEIIILSAIQGITEFLPISSSSHLILISKYFSFTNSSITLDLSLHLGSLLAIITCFKKDIYNFTKNKKVFLKILISSIPTIIVGYFLVYFSLIDYLRNYELIGWVTIFFGVLLYFGDLKKSTRSIKNDYNLKTAIYIGLFQILSLIPGVSRSGITITGARFFNFNRVDSVRISFLLSIPTLSATSFYGMQKLILEKNFYASSLNLLGVFLSFLFSYLTIKFFIKFLQKFSLTSFALYRVVLGLIILIYAY